MTFIEFKKTTKIEVEDICLNIYRNNSQSIKIKKENVAVKNLVSIIESTLKLSSQKGFHAMSLRDLCKESGLSMGALYSYFTSKEELLDMIYREGQHIIQRELTERIQDADTAGEKLRIAIRNHIYLSEILQRIFYFFYMEAKHLSPDGQKKAMAVEMLTESIYTDVITMGIEGKVFRDVDPVILSSLIKAMLQDWYLKRWKYRTRKITPDVYAESVINIIESYLKT